MMIDYQCNICSFLFWIEDLTLGRVRVDLGLAPLIPGYLIHPT